MVWLKWPGIVLGLLLLAYIGLLVYTRLIFNPRVAEEISTDPQGERAAIVMLLAFPDGRELPLNYLREGSRVFAGADGRWWRAFRDGNVPVTLLIRGETLTGKARVVLDDPGYRREVFLRLRPDVPKWLPEWLDGHLVVIDLDDQSANHARD